jgi:plastocyanin domain-containing protein
MLRNALSIVLALSLSSVAGCKHEDAAAPRPAAVTAGLTAGTVGPDGVRTVAVTADTTGYKPQRIVGKPGERLRLVFTRTAASTCIAQLVTPDKKTIELPMNTPVEVAVTVPATGEVGFACGMDMFHGVVVADGATR